MIASDDSLDLSLSISIPLLVFLHQRVAPYTKVEESFNIQAVHDILVSGIPLTSLEEKFTKSYDHVTFPGAVPRTFVGALLLAGASSPWLSWFNMAQAQALGKVEKLIIECFPFTEDTSARHIRHLQLYSPGPIPRRC